jgi:flagellar basal-body rod protein FlgB
MPASIESLTTATLSLALRAATLRQQAGAANIANARTAAYQPLRVAFEEHLGQARETLRSRGSVDLAALRSIRVELEPLPQRDAAPVQLDAEMATLARNALHHQALTQGLARHLGLLAAAVADGRK